MHTKFLRIIALLLFSLLSAVTAVADSIRCTMPNGTTQDFPGVEVQDMATNQAGVPSLNVRFTDGNVYPLELQRCQIIQFGEGGQGRLFDLTVLVNGAPQAFPQTRLFTYQNGQFVAQPQGHTSTYPIPAQNIVSIASAGAATGTQPEESFFGSNEAEDGGFVTDSSTATEEESYLDEDEEEEYDSEIDPNEDFATLLDRLANQQQSPTEKILGGIFTLLWLTTLIWLCSYAFQNGDTGWGIAMIVLCCCPPLKGFYVGKYQGSGRPIIMTLVIIELLMWIFNGIVLRT
jgi:hypothetical protein